MEYIPPLEIRRCQDVEAIVASGDCGRVIHMLWSFDQIPDAAYALHVCSRLADHHNDLIRISVVQALGLIVRRHQQLDEDRWRPVIEACWDLRARHRQYAYEAASICLDLCEGYLGWELDPQAIAERARDDERDSLANLLCVFKTDPETLEQNIVEEGLEEVYREYLQAQRNRGLSPLLETSK